MRCLADCADSACPRVRVKAAIVGADIGTYGLVITFANGMDDLRSCCLLHCGGKLGSHLRWNLRWHTVGNRDTRLQHDAFCNARGKASKKDNAWHTPAHFAHSAFSHKFTPQAAHFAGCM